LIDDWYFQDGVMLQTHLLEQVNRNLEIRQRAQEDLESFMRRDDRHYKDLYDSD
jgi:hypothetical protein